MERKELQLRVDPLQLLDVPVFQWFSLVFVANRLFAPLLVAEMD